MYLYLNDLEFHELFVFILFFKTCTLGENIDFTKKNCKKTLIFFLHFDVLYASFDAQQNFIPMTYVFIYLYLLILTLYDPVGSFKIPPPIFCPHAFNFGGTLLCVGNFS